MTDPRSDFHEAADAWGRAMDAVLSSKAASRDDMERMAMALDRAEQALWVAWVRWRGHDDEGPKDRMAQPTQAQGRA